VPAGRHRKTTSVQARLQRWGALTAPVVAVAAVVPAAGALDRGEPTVTTTLSADRVLSPSARAYVRTVSRDLVREEPPAPSMAEVYGLAEEAAEDAVPAKLSARWVSTALNVRARPSEASKLLTVIGSDFGWVWLNAPPV
jgi:hypothetical protein